MNKVARNIFRVVFVLAIVAGIMFAAYYIKMNYHVETEDAYVEGNTHYSTREIRDMVMTGPFGHNSLYLSLKYKNKKITDVPFVDSITVSVQTKTSIKISVFEKALAGYISYLDHYFYFDKDGYVVESSEEETPGIPQVVGISFDSVELGKRLGGEESDIFERTLDLTKLMDKYDLDVDKIYFHENGEVSLFFGQVRVKLGDTSSHLEDKIMDLPQFLEHLEGMKGVLDMEEYDEALGMYVFTKEE